MPVKDLIGRPRRTARERSLELVIRARAAALRNRRSGLKRDGGAEPVVPPTGPAPRPLVGGAALTLGD